MNPRNQITVLESQFLHIIGIPITIAVGENEFQLATIQITVHYTIIEITNYGLQTSKT